MNNNFCIIMAGGISSRFWPLSRNSKPKQFIDLIGTEKTLIQETYNRFKKVIPEENIFIVTNKSYGNLVKEQIPQINDNQIILEPSRRNTAPCITYASLKIKKINPNAKLVIAPSDQVILNEEVFVETINTAFEEIENKDVLLTLGVRPTHPDTGFGYIQYYETERKEDKSKFKNKNIKKVKTFTEKPEYDMALSFVQSGEFLWNSGLFICNVNSLIDSLKKYLSDIYSLFESIYSEINTATEKNVIENIYTECRNISIDYGIMEKADNVYVFISDFGWNDVGTWEALHEYRKKEENLNSVNGKNVMIYDTSNSFIDVPKEKLVVVQGLEDYIVVENDGILVICKKNEEKKIRQFVNDVLIEKGDRYL